MKTMNAVVFTGKDRIAIEDVSRSPRRARRSADSHHHHDDLRHRRAYRARRVPGQARPRARP